MNKQDYIEEIANCIADSWLAADAGDQVAGRQDGYGFGQGDRIASCA